MFVGATTRLTSYFILFYFLVSTEDGQRWVLLERMIRFGKGTSKGAVGF